MDRTSQNILVAGEEAALRQHVGSHLPDRYGVRQTNLANFMGDDSPSPDLILLIDNGTEIQNRDIRRWPNLTGDASPATIVLSAEDCSSARACAFRAGAADFVTFLSTAQCDNGVDTVSSFDDLNRRIEQHFLLRKLRAHDESVQRKLRSCALSFQQLADAGREQALFNLAQLAEARGEQSAEKLTRVRECACDIAAALAEQYEYASFIDDRFLANFQQAVLLHDVGNFALPDSLLLKPARLERDEFELMKLHTVMGGNLLQQLAAEGSGFLQMAAQIARHHHERWDGLGYPAGLRGAEIPLAARIFAVADVFDALISQRPYQAAFPPQVARQIIEDGRGRQFDPAAVDAFCRIQGDETDLPANPGLPFYGLDFPLVSES